MTRPRWRSRHKSPSFGNGFMIPDGQGGTRQVRPHEFATMRRLLTAGADTGTISLYLNLTHPDRQPPGTGN